MTTLSDTQSILLATAAQRESGSVLPLHGSVKPGGGAAKARANLLKQLLVEERETTDATAVHRTEGDVRFGLSITAAGLAAIGLGEDDPAATSPAVQLPEIIDVEKAPSRIATVLSTGRVSRACSVREFNKGLARQNWSDPSASQRPTNKLTRRRTNRVGPGHSGGL